MFLTPAAPDGLERMKEAFGGWMRQRSVWAWRRAAVRYPALPALKRRLSGMTLGITRLVYRGRPGGAGALDLDPANITWIFCVGRSGSTWLSNVMGELGGHTIWREPKIGQLFGEFYINTPKRKRDAANFIMGAPTRKAWISSIRNFVLVGARHAFPLLRPEHHLIIKEPGGGVGAPLLMEALPESRMILLVRDPRDIVASWLDAAGEEGWKKQNRRNGSNRESLAKKRPDAVVRKLARRYLDNLRMARQAYDHHRGPKTLVLYERLRVDTLGVMKRMYSDLGIEIDEAQLARAVEKHAWENIPEDLKGEGRFFRKASPGGWREDLTPDQARIVERITAPILDEFYA
jgi:Sulfotransferase domain